MELEDNCTESMDLEEINSLAFKKTILSKATYSTLVFIH